MPKPRLKKPKFDDKAWLAERQFMEGLVNARTSTLLVVVGLLANALVLGRSSPHAAASIAWVGFAAVSLLSTTVIRAHLRLRDVLRTLTVHAPNAPVTVGYGGYRDDWPANARPRVSADERLFRRLVSGSANNVVGLYLPLLLTLATLTTAVVTVVGG